MVLDRPAVRKRTDLLTLMVCALGGGTGAFAFLPPDNVLFTNLSGVNTWARDPLLSGTRRKNRMKKTRKVAPLQNGEKVVIIIRSASERCLITRHQHHWMKR